MNEDSEPIATSAAFQEKHAGERSKFTASQLGCLLLLLLLAKKMNAAYKMNAATLNAAFFWLIVEYITVSVVASVILQCLLQRCLATDA